MFLIAKESIFQGAHKGVTRSVKQRVKQIAACGFAIGLIGLASGCAHHGAHHVHDEQARDKIVPAHEHGTAAAQALAGPSENKGITAVNALGETALARDFPALEGRVLRAREIHIAPGGVVAAHTHEARPGVAYIVSGEIVEHRSDQAESIVRRAGDVSFEHSGVSHWWENVSDQPVRAVVIDIFESKDAQKNAQ